jgi:hypothetical protein
MNQKNIHPLEIEEVKALIEMFLEDVIFEYRENEIHDWLQGVNQEQIEEILNREHHEVLRSNSFIIPFTYLHYRVVPSQNLVGYLQDLMKQNDILDMANVIYQNTIKHFKRIFSGKTEYVYDANVDGSKSYE